MTALQVAAVYIGVNILLLIYLAFRVVQGRMKNRVSLGYGGDEDLETRARTHGNASEYIPAALIGLVVCAMLTLPTWAIHALGLTFTLGRLSHAFGMAGGVLPARQIGIILTWLSMLAIAGALFYAAFAL